VSCPSCEADGLDHDLIVQRCKASVYWTGIYLCGFHDFSPVLHEAINLWIEKKISEGWQRMLILAPRGHFKTSLISVARPTWKLINDPLNWRTILTMHSADVAIEKGGHVKDAFQSDAMAHFFPHLYVTKEMANRKGSLKWTDRKFCVPGQSSASPSYTCMGVMGGKEGGHWPDITWDDVIDGEAAESPLQIAAALKKLSVTPYLWEDRKRDTWLIAGTYWGGGFYEEVLSRSTFAKLVIGCYCDDRFYSLLDEVGIDVTSIDPDYINARVLPENRGVRPEGYDEEFVVQVPWSPGSPIFPERENMKSLKEMEADEPDSFPEQMLNIPARYSDKRFRREDCGFFHLKRDIRNRPLAMEIDEEVSCMYTNSLVTVAIDPTGGRKKTSDEAGVVASAWSKSLESAFVLEAWKGVVDPGKQVEILLDMAIRWKAKYLIIEGQSFQVTLEYWVKKEMRARGVHFPIQLSPTGWKSKGERLIEFIMPFFSRGQVYFDPQSTGTASTSLTTDEIITDLVNTRIVNGQIIGKSPAIADCLAMQAKLAWRRRAKRGSRIEKAIPSIIEDQKVVVPKEPYYSLKVEHGRYY